MDAGLYIVGTPIGNLADMTFRAVETLREADLVLAEDTRQTRKLLTRYEIPTRMMSCHKFNESARAALVTERVRGGQAVALVTDSGMPAVSDPGARMVSACREAGLPVTAVPGPSAVTTAVALSGFVDGGFVFEGFLPVKSGGRGKRLDAIAAETRPVVLYESPYRLMKLLTQLQERMPDRRVYVGRELTKRFEENRVGTPGELLEAYAGRRVKGEVVVIVQAGGKANGRVQRP